jgi:hypothetical protein
MSLVRPVIAYQADAVLDAQGDLENRAALARAVTRKIIPAARP